MSQLILNRGVSKSNLVCRVLKKAELGPYFLMFSLIGFVALITVITLMFSTQQITKGYSLNALKAENQDLVKQIEIKDMQISKIRSLKYLQESSQVRHMVRPDQIVFLNGDTAIASR